MLDGNYILQHCVNALIPNYVWASFGLKIISTLIWNLCFLKQHALSLLQIRIVKNVPCDVDSAKPICQGGCDKGQGNLSHHVNL